MYNVYKYYIENKMSQRLFNLSCIDNGMVKPTPLLAAYKLCLILCPSLSTSLKFFILCVTKNILCSDLIFSLKELSIYKTLPG